MPDLLIELFSEEIPARMQAGAREALRQRVTDGLVEAGLSYGHARAWSTPRRLVLAIEGLSARSPDLKEERKGPRVDAPEKALEGFLRSTGLTKDQLEARDDKKGQVWIAVIDKPGRDAAEIVAEVLEGVIRSFPWPKSMRWGAGSLRWVRPLHSILCLLTTEAGAEVVPLDIDGIRAGDTTRGHRFMAPEPFRVTGFEDYAVKLKRARVMLDQDERAEQIWHDATNAAFAQGLEVVEDKGLLTEVAGLVEWPVVLMGAIGEAFLDLPPEVLQTSMKEHQKFFSVKDPKTGRIVRFVTVANRETADNGETILKGNGKVLSARLSDAAFFWGNDLAVAKAGMEDWREALTHVTFQSALGSQADRIGRIAALAREIAPMVGADPDLAEQAAKVAKLDLASQMVYEFPELQGLMGRYYAAAAGLPAEVAEACALHYKPLGPSDEVPTAPVSVAVALADKLDTLTGFWAIDEKPTGSKDPFALRRAALGVIRLVLDSGLRLQLVSEFENGLTAQPKLPALRAAFAQAQDQTTMISERLADPKFVGTVITGTRVDYERDLPLYEKQRDELGREFDEYCSYIEAAPQDLLSFFHDRLKVHLRAEGIRHDVIDACLAMPGNDDLTLLVRRAEALQAVIGTEEGENLVQGFKRANNILSQAEEKDGVEYSFGADRKFADDPAEAALFDALDTAEAAIGPAMEAEDFAKAMAAMAALRAPIDAFFEAVQVNSDNEIIRRNRLNLLHRIRATCGSVADLTRIDG
ncbi:glycine--tRNA ligase subunit beta [Rhodovulum sulfidophilum]|uniref:Glycine--tRNA ligase beta subunit n=1 Tax=Rhodovulum visakhapatnamense TaxID=364297 RepID=A0ABS1RDY7_9RHOB|nr:glycine--tRNA ligase subunit beta [Rhodovulum visakhapatnamense]MBL3569259.1 glycine--tRNA ligase subunit beta [Rhodovulum visakhapatnamense]MBL3577485.1 glycine--tRNA ligase subunit beta [Rhodovulum visakhapatnamense]OLS44014.1 glycine--tRNA ligase subunit beta [Rhodovulum sulfidophilum]